MNTCIFFFFFSFLHSSIYLHFFQFFETIPNFVVVRMSITIYIMDSLRNFTDFIVYTNIIWIFEDEEIKREDKNKKEKYYIQLCHYIEYSIICIQQSRANYIVVIWELVYLFLFHLHFFILLVLLYICVASRKHTFVYIWTQLYTMEDTRYNLLNPAYTRLVSTVLLLTWFYRKMNRELR